jgi:hypothetical protein
VARGQQAGARNRREKQVQVKGDFAKLLLCYLRKHDVICGWGWLKNGSIGPFEHAAQPLPRQTGHHLSQSSNDEEQQNRTLETAQSLTLSCV